jgi:hypothetical protein
LLIILIIIINDDNDDVDKVFQLIISLCVNQNLISTLILHVKLYTTSTINIYRVRTMTHYSMSIHSMNSSMVVSHVSIITINMFHILSTMYVHQSG